MRKIICVIALTVIFSGMTFAKEVTPPQWNEFCPSIYLNAQPTKYNKEENYWYQRRVEFNEMINQSKQYQDQKLEDYYTHIRNTEISKNRLWQSGESSFNTKQKKNLQKTNDMNTMFHIRQF